MKKLLKGLMALVAFVGFTTAQADSVLVIDAGYSTVTQNVVGRLQAAGHTATIVSSYPGSMTGYQQVWDLRYSAALSSTEQTNLATFVTNGGFAYFVTENPGCCMSRNNSVAALVTSLGGGTTTIGGTGNNWAANIESNVNTTYMTTGITVNYAAVAAIVNSQGIPLISDSAGQVSGMSWIGRAGALGSGVTGTIVTVADTNWLDSTRFAVGGTSAQQQNVQALDDIITGIVAGTVGGTISASGNGAAASNGSAQQQQQNQAPTVTGTSTTNTVTTTTSTGQSTSTSATSYGTASVAVTEVSGTPVSVTTETRARGAQTTKTLSVSQTFTTVTTTPVAITTVTTTPFTTVVTTTTPITTTTTTTPVTTDTYSDGSTVVTTGTPVVTTSTANQVGTTTTTGNQVVTQYSSRNDVTTNAVTHPFATRIDQMSKLLRANGNTNTMLDSGVADRVGINGDHFVGQDGPEGYAIIDASRSNTVDSYQLKSRRVGAGFDYRVDSDLVLGAQANKHTTTLSGVGTGELVKDHFGIYSLHNVNGWLVKNDLAVARNTVTVGHSLNELGYANTAKTHGVDSWFASRLYTPDLWGFRPYTGVRWERNRLNGVTESGSAMTAVTYSPIKTLTRNEEVGVSFEQKLADDILVRADVNRTTLNYRTSTLALAYQIDKVSTVDLRVGQQRWDDVKNNMAQLNVAIKF